MNNNTKTKYIDLLHESGLLPDRYYYQLNGKSAQENYAEQRDKLLSDDYDNIHITSEVKVK